MSFQYQQSLQASWATTLPDYTLSPNLCLRCHLATGEAGRLLPCSFSRLRSQSLLVLPACPTNKEPPPSASQAGLLCGSCSYLSASSAPGSCLSVVTSQGLPSLWEVTHL